MGTYHRLEALQCTSIRHGPSDWLCIVHVIITMGAAARWGQLPGRCVHWLACGCLAVPALPVAVARRHLRQVAVCTGQCG